MYALSNMHLLSLTVLFILFTVALLAPSLLLLTLLASFILLLQLLLVLCSLIDTYGFYHQHV